MTRPAAKDRVQAESWRRRPIPVPEGAHPVSRAFGAYGYGALRDADGAWTITCGPLTTRPLSHARMLEFARRAGVELEGTPP